MWGEEGSRVNGGRGQEVYIDNDERQIGQRKPWEPRGYQ